jgi:hypothetical protein
MVSKVRSVITLFHASSATSTLVHFQHMVYLVEKLALLNNYAPFPSIVTLSAAKGLARWAERCFAALRMTIWALVGKLYHCAPANTPGDLGIFINSSATGGGTGASGQSALLLGRCGILSQNGGRPCYNSQP